MSRPVLLPYGSRLVRFRALRGVTDIQFRIPQAGKAWRTISLSGFRVFMIGDASIRVDDEAALTLGAPQPIHHVKRPVRFAPYRARARIIRKQMTVQPDAEDG